MDNINLGDLYLSKSELDDIVQLVAKKRHIKNYQNKWSNSLYKIFKKQSKNKKRIDNIREALKDLSDKLSKSEYKDIKTKLYNIEKNKKISLNKTTKYLDELDKKILKLDEYRDYDDYEYKGIKNIKDLFKTSISKDHYKPKLVKVGLSPSKKICVICLIERPLKMMNNVFYFILIALFILKIFKFLSRLFGHLGKTA